MNVLSLFVVTRVAISLWAALVLAVMQAPTSPDDVLRAYQGVEPISGGADELVLGVSQRSDAVDCQRIATRGYTDDLSGAFPPLLPGLVLFEAARLDHGELVPRSAALRGRLPCVVAATLHPVAVNLGGSIWYLYHCEQFPHSPFREVNAHLGAHIQPEDAIVLDSDLPFLPSHCYDRSLPQACIGDELGSASGTLALPTQQALGLKAWPNVAHATDESPRVWFVMFPPALDSAAQLGTEDPNKAWLDAHDHLATAVTFRDLQTLAHELA